MKMTTNTAAAIDFARIVFGADTFTARDWDKKGIRLTLDTAIRHHAVVAIPHVMRKYYTVADLVALLNDCAGDDCYNADWHYAVDDDGRAYRDFTDTVYRMA